MNKLERIILNIDYRDDYNGRPCAEIKDNYLIVKTHPFYCWERNRYGRCYRYDLYDLKSNIHIQDFKVYVYDRFDSVIDKFVINIYDNLNKHIFDEYNILSSDFEISKHSKNSLDIDAFNFSLVQTDIPKKVNMENFQLAKMNYNQYGFVVFRKNIYIITSNINDDYSVYNKENYTSDYKNTTYCNLYVNNFDNILPNSNYTKYNVKQYKRNQIELEQTEIALKNDPDCNFFYIEYPKDSDSDSDSDYEMTLDENYVNKNNKQVGQIFSCPGMLDILFINE